MMDLGASQGIVYLIGAGPGDPGLITLRGLECLQQAEVVVHDRLINGALLAYAPQAEWIDVGKQPDHHTVAQAAINALLVTHARQGKVVARLKGGDPFVFGRGGEEALALVEAGLPFEVVPGVSSATAAPAYAGIPFTHRDMACSAAVITGHRADCGTDPGAGWRRAAGADTLVFLMGVQNLAHIVAELLAAGRDPQTPVALVEQAAGPAQKTVVGSLENIVSRAQAIHPPAVIVVGEVVRLRERLAWYENPARRPLLGRRILDTRPRVSFSPAADCVRPGTLWLSAPDALGRLAAGLGAEVQALPFTRFGPLEDTAALDEGIFALAESPPVPWNWLLFTTPYAARAFLDRLFALGFDARLLGRVKLAAASAETAEALAVYHLRPDLVLCDPISDLASLDELAYQRVLALEAVHLPGEGRNASEDLALTEEALVWQPFRRALAHRGADLERLGACSLSSLPVQADDLQAALSRRPEVVIFGDPAAVAGLAGHLAHGEGAVPLLVYLGAPARQAALRCGLPSGLDLEAAPAERVWQAVQQALKRNV